MKIATMFIRRSLPPLIYRHNRPIGLAPKKGSDAIYRSRRLLHWRFVIPAEPEAFLLLESAGRRFPLNAGQSWTIGRGDGCAVTLDSRWVSRLHALIQRRDGGDYSLVDLGSRNGCFVNGQRVSLPRILGDGDRLAFGDRELLFRAARGRGSEAAPPGASTRNAPTAAMHMQSLATILVVDLRDFSRLARAVPEAVLAQTVGTWFLQVGQIAERHGSWARKYIGDAVMAVWLHDDPARLAADIARTLRAVDEIQIATAAIHNQLPLPAPLRIGAGVNTGTAIIGGVDSTALGEPVNAAFRLESATKVLGMGVALGERTYSELHIAGDSPFVRREVELKGYESPRTVWAISFEDLRAFLEG
jgi:adenylate cyclase